MSAETGPTVNGRSELQGGDEPRGSLSLRTLLNAVALAAVGAAAGIAGTSLPIANSEAQAQTAAQAAGAGVQNEAFRQKAHDVRVAAAAANREVAVPPHPTNGDE